MEDHGRYPRFSPENKAICYRGKTVVDLAEVAPGAGARLFSGATTDFVGLDTTFSLADGPKPFVLASTPLSVGCFIRAIVENRVQIEGMVTDREITEVYRQLVNRKTLLEPSMRGRSREDSGWGYYQAHRTRPAQSPATR